MATDRLIVRVLQHYFPDWEPPRESGSEWQSCLCPFHGESRPSASISFALSAFTCHACGEKGDAIGIIMSKEKMRYPQAVRYAEELSPGSSIEVRKEPPRKPRRRAFGR